MNLSEQLANLAKIHAPAPAVRKSFDPPAATDHLTACIFLRFFFSKDHASTQIEHTLNLVLQEFNCGFPDFERPDRPRNYSELTRLWYRWYQGAFFRHNEHLAADSYQQTELLLLLGLIPPNIQDLMLSILSRNPHEFFHTTSESPAD